MADLVAVTGANGWVGRRACHWLEQTGHAVRRLSRDARVPGTVAFDLALPAGDEQWSRALQGCVAVVHCAAHVHRPIETAAEQTMFQAINVAGTDKLLAASREAGVRRFVLAGSAAVYDWSDGRPLAEDGPVAPATAYARTKLQAEELVRASGLDWRIGRLATIYGAGDGANFLRLARALRARRFVIPGRGEARKSVLPVDRAGELLARLAVTDEIRNRILNLAAPVAPDLSEICEGFSQACGFPPAPHAPRWLLAAGARLGDGARALRLPAPLTSETLRKLTTPTQLDVARMQQSFPDLAWRSFGAEVALAASHYAAT